MAIPSSALTSPAPPGEGGEGKGEKERGDDHPEVIIAWRKVEKGTTWGRWRREGGEGKGR